MTTPESTSFGAGISGSSANRAEFPPWRKRLTAPRTTLGALLVAALGLAFAPPSLTDPVRHGWQYLLRPSQAAVDHALDIGSRAVTWVRGASASAERLATAESEAARLAEQNRQLEAELELIRGDATTLTTAVGSGDSLLLSDTVTARVLGSQAQAYLKSRDLLDAGSRAGIAAGSLVTDAGPAASSPGVQGFGPSGEPTRAVGAYKVSASRASARGRPVLDAGGDLGLDSGGLVLAGRRVWGRIASVGPYTSVVERVCEPGYRDTVQIGHVEDRRLRLGPRGLLVGGGGSQARIELVEASQPVAVDDEVYTADDGVLRTPLLYGRIVRLERTSGNPYWQIWMEPAVGAEEPRTVAVLRMELNPGRVASRPASTDNSTAVKTR
jgi:cell shape-determining protein MreC